MEMYTIGRGGVVERELACHPKVPSLNLVRTYKFFSLVNGAALAATALGNNT